MSVTLKVNIEGSLEHVEYRDLVEQFVAELEKVLQSLVGSRGGTFGIQYCTETKVHTQTRPFLGSGKFGDFLPVHHAVEVYAYAYVPPYDRRSSTSSSSAGSSSAGPTSAGSDSKDKK